MGDPIADLLKYRPPAKRAPASPAAANDIRGTAPPIDRQPTTPQGSFQQNPAPRGSFAWMGGGAGASSYLQVRANAAAGADAVTLGDDVILCDTAAGNQTENLPTAIGCKGKVFRFKKTTTDANTVTLDGSGAQTIDGAATYVLAAAQESVEIVSDGANWQVV